MHEQTTCPVCGGNNFALHLTTHDFHLTGEEFALQSCTNCGLLVTSPRPEDSQLMNYYQSADYISHTGRGTNLVNRLYLLARRFTLRQKVRLINRLAGNGAVLDFGCGTGGFLNQAERMGWMTYGVEPSKPARLVALRSQDRIYADLKSCPALNVDAITLWHVLEHLPDPNATLDQLRNKLSRTGTIFIAVPNVRSYDGLHYGAYWAGLDVPRHLWHFNQRAMTTLLGKHALKPEAVVPMKLDSYYVSLLSEKYLANGKLSLPSFFRAAKTGHHSNRAARKSTEYSSLIYVAKK